MQPNNERPESFRGRPASPFAAPPQSFAASRTSSPMTGLGAPVAPQITMPAPVFGAVSTPELSTHGTSLPPPVRFNGPSSPPPPASYSTQGSSAYQQTHVPQFSPAGQPQFPPTAQPQFTPTAQPQFTPTAQPQFPPTAPPQFTPSAQPVPPLRGPLSSQPAFPPPGSLHPQPPTSSVPIGFPPHNANQFTATRPPPQSHLPGYTNILPRGSAPFPSSAPVSQPSFPSFPGAQPSFHAHQSQVPPPGPPPVAAPLGFNYREPMHYPSAGPPTASSLQGLIEDFQSLSVGSVPGSLDPGLDPKLLPRPSTDEEPTSVLETYPLNCHPRFLRLTTHAIPNSQSLASRWHLPLGAVVHPLAEAPDGEEVPIVNFGPAGVIRCRRCRTYINPYVTFTDSGRKWRCNLCSLLNEVPADYFCPLDATGRRSDVDHRPELSKGSVEFVAPTEYMVRPPMPPLYFFLIDVSASAVQSGLLEVVAKTIKSCLDDLPGFPRTQIGFLTFDSTLHFYSLKSSLTQPQMMVVADLDDIFLPLPDDLLVNLSDSRDVVDSFLDSLPSMFQQNTNVESAFGPAIKAAYMVMSQLGGKLLVFQSTLPSLGVGRLRLRGDDPRLYGTDKEHTLRIPEDTFYKQMAAEFTKNQIAVDIYAFSNKYIDIASLGTLAKYTGGQVYHYPSFQAPIHHEKLRHDLSRDLRRETAWESVMRIRCGKGVRFTNYHGHLMLRSTDLLALPAVDCDKAFGMQFALEESLMTTQTVYFQVALLYTSSSGERRIRVHTSAAPVVTDLGEMYRRADIGAIISVLSRLAIENTISHKLEEARQFINLKIVKSLKEYRSLYAVQHRLGSRLIYPESLKLLPLYALCLWKSTALRGGHADVILDERCAAGHSLLILPIKRMLKLLYPSLLRIDDFLSKTSVKFDESSEQLALTSQSLDPAGIYLYDDGFSFVVWFGGMVPPVLINDIIGADSSYMPDLSKVVLSENDNETSRKFMQILRKLREKDPSSHQLCSMVRQGERPRETNLLLNKLIEDQSAGTSSYLDWILQIYRQSQSS